MDTKPGQFFWETWPSKPTGDPVAGAIPLLPETPPGCQRVELHAHLDLAVGDGAPQVEDVGAVLDLLVSSLKALPSVRGVQAFLAV